MKSSFYLSTRIYCDGENNRVEILTDVQLFSTPEYKNIVYKRKYCNSEKELT
jgi:hypothetical protein